VSHIPALHAQADMVLVRLLLLLLLLVAICREHPLGLICNGGEGCYEGPTASVLGHINVKTLMW
jgi:hypothetical protein